MDQIIASKHVVRLLVLVIVLVRIIEENISGGHMNTYPYSFTDNAILDICYVHFLFLGISGSFRLRLSPPHGVGNVSDACEGALLSSPAGTTGPVAASGAMAISQSVSGSLLEDVGESSSTKTSCTSLHTIKKLNDSLFRGTLMFGTYE